jgi:hypothetical protein
MQARTQPRTAKYFSANSLVFLGLLFGDESDSLGYGVGFVGFLGFSKRKPNSVLKAI